MPDFEDTYEEGLKECRDYYNTVETAGKDTRTEIALDLLRNDISVDIIRK